MLFCTHYVGNMIYHKFSHNDVTYRFNGKTVKGMLEFAEQNFVVIYFLKYRDKASPVDINSLQR